VSRARRNSLIAVAVIAFLAVSVLVARVLSAASAERSAVVTLIEDQVSGDAAGVIADVKGCAKDAGCTAATRVRVARLRSPRDKVEVVRFDGPSSFVVVSRTGVARIVWKTQTGLPTVQCVRVRRSGDVLSGFKVSVLGVSSPIGREESCDGKRF
jgi:hypothetical protein